MGNARKGERRSEIFEGINEILREGEPRMGTNLDDYSILKEVRATVCGSA